MKFKDIYSRPGPIISFEFFPPKKPDQADATRETIRRVSLLSPDLMTVTYGAGGSTRAYSRELVSFIVKEFHLPAVAHLTCVGHSRDEIDQILENLWQDGVRHVLALRGDPPQNSSTFEAHPEGFSCARDLVRYIKKNYDFEIAVAGYPETHADARSPEDDLKYLREKIDAGAELVFTQLFFDVEFFLRFRERCDAIGIEVPIVPGLMPISNVGQLERFTNLCGSSIPETIAGALEPIREDRVKVCEYGQQLCLDMSRKLLKEGAPGIHFYTLNRSSQMEFIVRSLRDS